MTEINKPLTIEDFNIAMDMMAMEHDTVSKIIYAVDGLGITESGSVVYTDRDTINYEKRLREQKKKQKKTNHLELVK